MKIAYNPTTAAALTAAPQNNDITFDLKGVAVYARGVKFKGTDTTYSVFKKHTSESNTGGHNGLVPVPSYTTTQTRYLREDGTWVVPTNTTYAVVSSTANGLAPKIGTAAAATIATQADEWVLTSTKGGTPTWRKLPTNAFKNDNTTYTLSGTLSSNNYTVTLTPSSGSATTATIPVMTGATSSAAGKAGLVPVPAANKHTSFLRGDGTWVVPADTHYTTHLYIGAKDAASNAATTNGNTYIKVTDNSTIRNQYIIKGSGNTSVSSDDSGNITINSPTTISWDKVSGKPSTFTPSSHTHPTSAISALTGYTKATSAAALSTSDTLNVALGKLEYKAHYAYDWIINVTKTDSDEYINKWNEIVDFLNGVTDTTLNGILTNFVNALEVTGSGNAVTDVSKSNNKITVTKGNSFLPLSGGTLTANGVALTIKRYTENPIIGFNGGSESVNERYGYLGFSGKGRPAYIDATGRSVYPIIHSGNIGSQSVASADKLTTARSIWGQSFDGTANVSGALSGATTITASSDITCGGYIKSSTTLYLQSASSTSVIIKINGGTELARFSTNGNVGIGTTSPTQKLHVSGNILATKFITSGGTSSQFVKGDGSLDSTSYATASSLGNYLPLSGGTMALGEGLKFHYDENYFGTNLDARIISLLDGNGTTCDGGLIIDERATSGGTTTITELLRIRDAEFKWKGHNIYHAGNLSKSTLGLGNVQNTAFYKRVVTVNGSGWDMAGTNSNNAFFIYAPTSAGTSGLVLSSTGGTPGWINLSSISAGYATSAGSATTATRLLTNNTSQAADACYTEDPGLRFWRFNGTGNNIGGGDGWILSWSWNSGSVGGQIYLDDNPSKIMAIRGYNTDKTFTTWSLFIHSGNIGSQSVNYATSAGSVAWTNVTGKPSSFTPSSHTHDDRYYTESEADSRFVNVTDDTMTGRLTMAGGGIIITTNTSSNYRSGVEFYKGTSRDATYSYDAQIGWHNTGGDGTGSICILPYATSTQPWGGAVGLFITKTLLKYNNNTIWHAGNDGSGSGLDADKLDGIHASGLFTNLSNSGNNISITIGGTNKTLTPAYATSAGNADKVDGFHIEVVESSAGSNTSTIYFVI